MRYQAICFDFDYTLGDSTGPIAASATAALVEMGWPAPQREAVRQTIGYTLEDGYTMFTGDSSREGREEFYRRFRAHAGPIMVRDTVLFPGAGALLDRLREQGVPVGIVSTKGSDAIRGIFQRQGLLDRLQVIVGGRDVTRPKPDPEGLVLALERLGCPPSAALFCGDTVMDAEAARRAGVDFCAVLNGTTPAEAFADYPHVQIARSLDELRRWLDELA